jgi:type IV secretion system protein VirB8
MSAVLNAGMPPAATDSRSAADSRPAFDANRAWELDRALMLEKSERRGWMVGGVGVVLAILGVLAVFAQGPLRQVVGVPIVVDKTTGETTIQQRLSVESVPPQEALDKHNLAVFVRAREGYSWWWLQRDFEQVARTAVPAVFADYNRLFEGDTAVQKKLAGTEEWRINVVGVRLSPAGRRGNKGDATVTYDKVTRQTERNLPEVTTRHVASVVYEYQPKVLAKEKDRLENPFGFVVTAYRSDPEINTPSASPAVATSKP